MQFTHTKKSIVMYSCSIGKNIKVSDAIQGLCHILWRTLNYLASSLMVCKIVRGPRTGVRKGGVTAPPFFKQVGGNELFGGT